MRLHQQSREGFDALTLPLIPIGSILSPIPSEPPASIPFVQPLFHTDAARSIFERHDRHVALIDQPGEEEQWRLSKEVIKVSKEINYYASRVHEEVGEKLKGLEAAIERLIESIPIDERILRNGQWGGENFVSRFLADYG